MKFIQVAGAARSGKTTTVLNLRNEFGVLYADKEYTYLPEYKILFLGPGMKQGKFKRKAGADRLARHMNTFKIYIEENILGYFPEDTTVIMDTFVPVVNLPILSEHERVVKFCETSKAQYLKRNLRNPVEHYLAKQEEYLSYFQEGNADLTIWPSTMNLYARLDDIAKEIGLSKITSPVIDFRKYSREV